MFILGEKWDLDTVWINVSYFLGKEFSSSKKRGRKSPGKVNKSGPSLLPALLRQPPSPSSNTASSGHGIFHKSKCYPSPTWLPLLSPLHCLSCAKTAGATGAWWMLWVRKNYLFRLCPQITKCWINEGESVGNEERYIRKVGAYWASPSLCETWD